MNLLHTTPRRARQAGFTLVEMMVAITIGLIVMFGMTVTFVNLKSTFKSQDKLAQLQDNERLALTFLTNSINEAGYWPNPKVASTIGSLGSLVAPASLPASPGGTMPIGVGIYGTASGAGVSESLQTAYDTQNTDGLLSCIGTTYTGALTHTVRNIYYVDTSTNSLMCRVLLDGGTTDAMTNGGTPQVLVTGVSSLQVLYGVAGNSASPSQVTTYLGAAAGPAWSSVKAVRITLTFTNPFGGTDLQRTHTINVMN